MLICKYCQKECKNKNSYSNHERTCPKNKNRIYVNYMTGKKGSNQHTKGTAKTLTKEQRLRISERNKLQKWDDQRRLRHSQAMKKAVLNNPESYTSSNVCGRTKIYEYAGEKFHGKWEVEVAKWFDKNNIKWQRKVDPFSYYWNNAWHLYFPDFYLPLHNVFVEVKGFETDRDRAKWESVKNLIVFKKREIELIKNNGPVTHLVESAQLIIEEAGFESPTAHQD